jgi:DNA-binding CsgD family transcriptional regulator
VTLLGLLAEALITLQLSAHPTQEPADEETDYQPGFRRERNISREADKDAERQPDRRADNQKQPRSPTPPVPVHVVIGWSFLAAGLVSWARRPENRLGLLMTLTGIIWFGRDFDWIGSWTANHASELSQNLFVVLLAHQIVVFPYGTTRSRPERALVAAAYALGLLAYPPSKASTDANTALSALGIVLAGAIVYLVVDRWLHATPTERSALRPLVLVGPPVLVVVAVSIVHDYIDVSLSPTGDRVLDWCALVYTAIPLAVLLGVLRTRLRRALMGRLLAELSGDAQFEDEALQAAAEAARHALRGERLFPDLAELASRQLEVLALIAEGSTDRGIAQKLYVSPKTVEAHVRSIFRKLDVPADPTANRRVHAVLTFLRARTP